MPQGRGQLSMPNPGGIGGFVTLSRKGSGHITLNVKGKSAHAGRNYQDGASAILELAHKTLEIDKFLDISKSITVNTGLVEGGISANSVAPAASSKIHITYQTREQGEELVKNIRTVANSVFIEGTETEMTGGLRLYPLERSEKGICYLNWQEKRENVSEWNCGDSIMKALRIPVFIPLF